LQFQPVSLDQQLARLNPGDLKAVFDALLEYEKILNKEARQDGALSQAEQDSGPGQKSSEIGSDNEKIHDAFDQAQAKLQQLGSLGAGNLLEILYLVLKNAAEGNAEDLRSIMNKVKMINDRKAPRRAMLKRIAGAGAIVLLVGILLLGSNFIPNPGPPDAPASEAAQVVDPALLLGSAITPTPAAALCEMDVLSPLSTDEIPVSGPMKIAWASISKAFSYELQLIPPAGAGNPWVTKTTGPSKSIYMENLPWAGSYDVVISALGADGRALCSQHITFEKTQGDLAEATGKEGEGGKPACDPNGIFGC